MTNQPSTSPTPALKKPRRHPASRGMRKHVRELKRLGLVENHEHRQIRLLQKASASRGSGGNRLQQVRVSELPIARTDRNLCPASGCGNLNSNGVITVVDRRTNQPAQVRRCSRCEQLYRSFELPIFAKLPPATNRFNDCPHVGCGWQSVTSNRHISSVLTADVGRATVCTCEKCGKLYRPYVDAGSGTWTSI